MNKEQKSSQQSMQQFPLSSDDIRLIADIGFMAATNGFVVPSLRVFEGLRTLRPAHSFPYIGLALARITVGAFNDAIRLLRDEGLQALPDDEDIQLYLSLALHFSNQQQESQRLLSAVLKNEELDPAQKSLASSVLSQSDGTAVLDNRPQPAKVVDIAEVFKKRK
jgi:hypothetical protein